MPFFFSILHSFKDLTIISYLYIYLGFRFRDSFDVFDIYTARTCKKKKKRKKK
jgi:hypothetical protein